jgi:FMN-dependent NADH-azoreductase
MVKPMWNAWVSAWIAIIIFTAHVTMDVQLRGPIGVVRDYKVE